MSAERSVAGTIAPMAGHKTVVRRLHPRCRCALDPVAPLVERRVSLAPDWAEQPVVVGGIVVNAPLRREEQRETRVPPNGGCSRRLGEARLSGVGRGDD